MTSSVTSLCPPSTVPAESLTHFVRHQCESGNLLQFQFKNRRTGGVDRPHLTEGVTFDEEDETFYNNVVGRRLSRCIIGKSPSECLSYLC